MSVPGSSTVSSTGYLCQLSTPDDGDRSKQEALHWGIFQRLGEIVSHLSIQGGPTQSLSGRSSPDSRASETIPFLCLTLMFCVCVCVCVLQACSGVWTSFPKQHRAVCEGVLP